MGAFRVVGARLCIVLAAFFLYAVPANAADDFYKGKRLTIVIGTTPPSGYDLYARLLGRFWGRHLPGNPTVVPQNMPGAGSLTAANYVYNVAPKDGTYVGAIANGIPLEPLFSGEGVKFDVAKISWIGNLNEEVNVLVMWHSVPVKTLQDLVGRETGVVAAQADPLPRVLNTLMGTNLKVTSAYRTPAESFLAMQRGEVEGRAIYWTSVKSTQMDLYKSGKFKILLQAGLKKHRDLPDVPFVLDFAKTDEERRLMEVCFSSLTIGRPIMAPPDIPASRLAELRNGFDQAVADPDLLAEAEKQRLEISPMSGADLEKIIRSIYSAPPDVVARARALVR